MNNKLRKEKKQTRGEEACLSLSIAEEASDSETDITYRYSYYNKKQINQIEEGGGMAAEKNNQIVGQSKYDLDAKWDACLDLTVRQIGRASCRERV